MTTELLNTKIVSYTQTISKALISLNSSSNAMLVDERQLGDMILELKKVQKTLIQDKKTSINLLGGNVNVFMDKTFDFNENDYFFKIQIRDIHDDFYSYLDLTQKDINSLTDFFTVFVEGYKLPSQGELNFPMGILLKKLEISIENNMPLAQSYNIIFTSDFENECSIKGASKQDIAEILFLIKTFI